MSTRFLPVVLQQEEFEAKAAELAALQLELDQLNDDKKGIVAEFKAKTDKASARIRELSAIVDRHSEPREVEIEDRVNMDKRIVEIYRTDTGEMIDTRNLTPQDIQLSMDLTMRDFERNEEA